jgi:glycosyltransferase involved in cell wall biosynthesis/thymidylate kinase
MARLVPTIQRPLARILIVTELSRRPDEGMRNWCRQVDRAVSSRGHSIAFLDLEGDPRWAAFRPSTARAVRRSAADLTLYVPYSGLTRWALWRLMAVRAARAGRSTAIVVLQAAPAISALRPVLRVPLALCASRRLASVASRVAREVVIFPAAIDLEQFRPPGTAKADLRSELGLPAEGRIVLHVGHLRASRNLELLAEMGRVEGRHVVVIASTSTPVEPEILALLRRSGVRVIRELIPRIERYYQAADVYVFPVVDEQGSIEVPLTVLEAAACGTPVVTTRFGGLPEIFDGSAGITFAPPESMKAAVDEALQRTHDPAAIRAAVERFTPMALADTIAGTSVPGPRRRGRLIAISGIDGAGKSTQAERLRIRLAEQGLAATSMWCRWDPLLSKPAVRLLGFLSRRPGRARSGAGPETPSSDARGERRRELRGRLLKVPGIRSAWTAMLVVDYGLRVAPRVRAALRRHDVVIVDRYWYDVMVDLSAGGDLRSPPPLLRRLFPCPDALVVLDLPEADALRRKPDSPDVRHLELRRTLFRQVAQNEQGVMLDALAPVDALESSIADALGYGDLAGPGEERLVA